MRKLLSFFLFLSVISYSQAQELNTTVKINAVQLQTVDPAIFETLEQSIREFMNDTKWTDDVVELDERIDVNLVLTLEEGNSPTEFNADIAIQASRPVYNASYITSLINHIDKDVSFTYKQYQPIQYSENRFNDNLSHVLAFYAYTILGLDYDSFSPFGGEVYFRKAQDMVNNVPSSAQLKGWKSTDNNFNRYWIQENFLSPRLRPFRQGWYDYHRFGLDMMATDPEGGRAVIASALENFQVANQAYPNSNVIQIFVNSKNQEIIEIFKGGTPVEQTQVINIMGRLDRANSTRYREIR